MLIFCVETSWVCSSVGQRFRKNDSDSSLELLIVTRVESFCEKRLLSSQHFSQDDSSRVRLTKNSDRVEIQARSQKF